MNPPGNLRNTQMLIYKVWGVARDSVLLTNSQVMLMLPAWSMGHALSSKISLLSCDADEDTEVDWLQVGHSKWPYHPPISGFPAKATLCTA